jgi:hypothetical protein
LVAARIVSDTNLAAPVVQDVSTTIGLARHELIPALKQGKAAKKSSSMLAEK